MWAITVAFQYIGTGGRADSRSWTGFNLEGWFKALVRTQESSGIHLSSIRPFYLEAHSD